MRILVLIHEYPPVGGGGGRVAQDLCSGLAERGHAVRVLTAHWGDLPKEENADGVEIRRLASGRKLPYKAGLDAMAGYVLAAITAGLGEIRRWKPDVIHVHFAVPAGPIAYSLNVLTGVPYLLTAHLGDVPGGVPDKTGRWFRFIQPFTPPIWKRAAKIAAVSEYTRGLALQHYPVPVQVIPNGVDLAALPPRDEREPQPRILFAGRFVGQKDPLQVIRSLGQVAGLPWTCTMLGDGPLRPLVEAEIDRLGLRQRFELPGWVTPEQVLGWMAHSDLLFMPSLSEGLPVVGVQALGLGMAMVASNVGGFVDLIEPEVNGFLGNPQQPENWAAALRALLSDLPRLRAFQSASLEKARAFDLPAIVRAYEQMLEGIVQSG